MQGDMQGEEEEDLALFGDRREWVGRFWMRTSASLSFSPRPSGRTRGAHPSGRRSGPSAFGRLRSTSRGRIPPHPSSPRASASEASSWPRGRRHASSGLGRPIPSAIDRPSLWRSSSRTLRSALSPRRPLPPALQFFNGFFNGEGTPGPRAGGGSRSSGGTSARRRDQECEERPLLLMLGPCISFLSARGFVVATKWLWEITGL
jgi:hypothetical protein